MPPKSMKYKALFPIQPSDAESMVEEIDLSNDIALTLGTSSQKVIEAVRS